MAQPGWAEAALPADPQNTLMNPHLTYTYDKVSCMSGAFTAHMIFAWLVFLSGLCAMLSRLLPARWGWKGDLHLWLGRIYIMAMLWCTATSLIIHNTGLPPATLISFVWVLGGMCVGWVLIKFHQSRMDAAATAAVQAQQLADGVPAKDLRAALASARADAAASKGFAARFFSLKAAHGIIMFVSWINVAGRIFASDQRQDYVCHTHPVYKPLDSKHFAGADAPLTLLPTHDPNYARLPWARLGLVGWSLVLLFAPAAGAALVGAIFSALAARRARAPARPAPTIGAAGAAGAGGSDGSAEAVEAGLIIGGGAKKGGAKGAAA